MKVRSAAVTAFGALVLATCHNANDPSPPCYVEPPLGTHQSLLSEVLGSTTCGNGGTSVTSVPVPEGYFVATIRFIINRAKPNTTYYVQRAAEFSASTAATDADGICQRADGLPPWSGFSPLFVNFPIPWRREPLITVTTDAEGNGAVEFEHQADNILRGAHFDVQMRLIDDPAGPTSELRSGCMKIEVR